MSPSGDVYEKTAAGTWTLRSTLATGPAGAPGAPGAMVQLFDRIVTGSVAANIDFPSIPASYAALRAVFTGRGDTAAGNVVLNARFNNDSGNNYTSEVVQGFATTLSGIETVTASALRIGSIAAASVPVGHASTYEIVIPNYAGTTFFKYFGANGGWTVDMNTNSVVALVSSGAWASTAALNRITLFPAAGNFVIGSRLTVYGMS